MYDYCICCLIPFLNLPNRAQLLGSMAPKEHDKRRKLRQARARAYWQQQRWLPYVVAVQVVGMLATAVVLLWVGPEWWDIMLHYLLQGWRILPGWYS